MLHTILTLPNDVLRGSLVPFLDLKCFVQLDSASLCKHVRPRLLDTIFRDTLLPEQELEYDLDLVSWVKLRGMFVKCLNFLHHGACDDELLFALPVMSRAVGFQLPEGSNITNKTLETVFASFHTLEQVQFTNCYVDDNAIAALASSHPKLQSFRAIGCEYVSDFSMTLLAQKCPGLCRLNLDESTNISDETVDALAQHCVITEFFAVGCLDMTCGSLVRLLQKSGPHLRILDLSGFPELGDELFALAKHCPNVDHLYLNNCPDLEQKGLRAVIQACQNLVVLEMQESSLDRETLLCMSAHISPALTDLQLYRCPEMTDEILLPILQRLANVDALFLNNCPITNASLIAISNLHPHLYELHLAGCAKLSLEGISAFVRASTQLRLLCLDNCPLVCNECVAEITIQTSVEELGLAGCDEVTDEGMQALGTHLHTLEEVDLSHTSVTDESVMFLLASCPDLTKVSLLGRGDVDARVVAAAQQRGVDLVFDNQHNHTNGGFVVGEDGVIGMFGIAHGHTDMDDQDSEEEESGGEDEEMVDV